jgi:prepilin-type N-terminal cleavage/methylation domain-containing protein
VKRLGNQKGLTLVEVLIALTIFAAISVSLFIALNVSHKTTHSVNEQTTAESLTRAELEYIKSCDYDAENNPPVYGVDPDLVIPTKYSIGPPGGPPVVAERLDPEGDGFDNDDGIQKVTVKVYYDGELVLTTASYKMMR